METLKGKCSACGAPVEVIVAEPFAAASLASALCPGCTDQQFLEEGGAILHLRQEPEGARFPLGKVTITAGAVSALGEARQHTIEFLARHARGDWGECGFCDEIHLTTDERRLGWEATDDPGKINKVNLLKGRDRIISEYRTGFGTRLWVITRIDRGGGTTVLLPEED